MRALIIGGTRNLGHTLALELLRSGWRVTTLNRGITRDELPAAVERLRADRSDRVAVESALRGREHDVVVDTTLYTGPDARAIVDLLRGRVGRYVFLSTGQVYLVRLPPPRPAREEDYAGPLMPPPEEGTPDRESWRYGVEKRDAEDVLADAHAREGFPFVSLRLPMVNGERDHYDRIRNYLARLDDGGPILVPDESGLPVRHVYAGDVVRAITLAISSKASFGRAYNVSQDETLSLEEFLRLLGALAEREVRLQRAPRELLEEQGLLPDCSPFSGRWTSVLDNRRGVAELGMRYTPLPSYLERIVSAHRRAGSPLPAGYASRQAELELARGLTA